MEDKIIKVLRKTGNITFAFLFGSRIKNEARLGSDLDIAVLFEISPNLSEIGKLVSELEEIAGCDIDLILLNNLYENNPKLAYSIIGEGILLFCENNELLIRYKEKTYIKYLDFKPVIDLFAKKLEERIINNKFAVVER